MIKIVYFCACACRTHGLCEKWAKESLWGTGGRQKEQKLNGTTSAVKAQKCVSETSALNQCASNPETVHAFDGSWYIYTHFRTFYYRIRFGFESSTLLSGFPRVIALLHICCFFNKKKIFTRKPNLWVTLRQLMNIFTRCMSLVILFCCCCLLFAFFVRWNFIVEIKCTRIAASESECVCVWYLWKETRLHFHLHVVSVWMSFFDSFHFQIMAIASRNVLSLLFLLLWFLFSFSTLYLTHSNNTLFLFRQVENYYGIFVVIVQLKSQDQSLRH